MNIRMGAYKGVSAHSRDDTLVLWTWQRMIQMTAEAWPIDKTFAIKEFARGST